LGGTKQMKPYSILLVLAALFSVASATPTIAATVIVTYAGTVTNGVDQTGQFGVAGADLTGNYFSTKLVFDTARGNTNLYGDSRETYGGIFYNTTNPLISASLTINGHTIEPTLASYAELGAYYYDGYFHQSIYVVGVYYEDNKYFSTSLGFELRDETNIYPGKYDNYSGEVVGWGSGTYQLYSAYDDSDEYLINTVIDLSSSSMTVSISAVPEPATWAMMLSGFGMIGFAARRRQRVKTTIRYT
jgi:hypothetical protein